MNDPFHNGKKEVIGMDMYQLNSGIVSMQKSDYPVGQQCTETYSPIGNFFLKITVILNDICKSAYHTCRSWTLARSVFRSIREQKQYCED